MASLLLLVALAILSGTGIAEEQCTDLGFSGVVQRQSGKELRICNTEVLQCCDESFITTVNDSAVDLVRAELQARIQEPATRAREINDRIFSYFCNNSNNSCSYISTFVGDWIDSTTAPNPLNVLSGLQLREVYEHVFQGVNFTHGFNGTALVENIKNSTVGTAGTFLGRGNETIESCVQAHLYRLVNTDGEDFLRNTFSKLNQNLSILHEMGQFLYDSGRFGNLPLPEGCVQQFVDRNFCRRCTSSTPPLCSNTCRSLLIGCLSPYYKVLSGEVNIFVNVASQIVEGINAGLQSFFTTSRRLFNADTSLPSLNAQCGVTPEPMTINQTAARLFDKTSRLMELRNLDTSGPFNYNGGFMACHPSGTVRQSCPSPPGGTRRVGNCNLTVACTSDCDCFNGMEEQRMNTVKFSRGGINAQVNNTAIDISCSALNETAFSLGTPLWNFLNGLKMRGAFPSGVELPSRPNLDDVQCGGASIMASMSWTWLCLVVLLLVLGFVPV